LGDGADSHSEYHFNTPRVYIRTAQIQRPVPDERREVEYLGKKLKSTHDSNNGEGSRNYQVHMYETPKKSTKPDLTCRTSPSEGRLTPWSEVSILKP
jgi:hypothetical protein